MDRRQPKLDDPLFQGRLRLPTAAAADLRWQVKKPVKHFQDVSVRKSIPAHPAHTAEKHKHHTQAKPASKLHHRPSPHVLQRNEIAAPKPVRAVARPIKNRGPKLLYALAVIVFLIGIGVSLKGMLINQKAQAQINNQSKSKTLNEEAPPSAVKPTDAQIRSYSVASDAPRYIDIPTLGVHSRVFPVGTTRSGALAAPSNIYNTAWYKNSSKPGQMGAMLVDGHSGLNADGVFNDLNKLKTGDLINITRGDNKVFSYQVVKSKIFAANQVDMASLMVSANTASPGLNLITCAGDPIPGTFDLNQRIAIFAVMQ